MTLTIETQARRGPKQAVNIAVRLSTILLATGVLFASPAVAGCLGHPEENFCYALSASFSHNTEPGYYVADFHSGATPQTASIGREQGGTFASADSAHNG